MRPPLQDFQSWAPHHLSVAVFLERFNILPTPNDERRIIADLLADAEQRPPLQVSVLDHPLCLYIHAIECGELRNVVAYKWWQQWREYVDFDAPTTGDDVGPGRHGRRPSFFQQKQRPTAIDNSDLQCQHDQHLLRDDLQEDYDYVLLPPAAHDMLHSWYTF